jgi:serine/threonine protein kinase
VGLDPLDDEGQQLLIQLLAETGSRSEALAQYDRYQALLEAELGLNPLDETVELVEAIRLGTIKPAPGPFQPPEILPSDPVIDGVKGPGTLRELMDSELSPSLEVLRPISQGNMAEVFLAREPLLKRLVAVKVLSPDLYSDPRARKRFEREAQAAARINHPHVCTVHRVGSLSDGTPFLVSPFIKGTTLEQRLKAEGRLGPAEVRRVLREVASALAAAHKIGILHRDVRPDNILRADESGRHSLCDFGLSGVLESGAGTEEPRLTRTGEILGSPAYISPEQLEGETLTDRSDVYSLGILAHQLLTGHPPPPPNDSGRQAGKKGPGIRLEPLKEYLGETDSDLVELIEKCLAVDPSHRPRAADIEERLSRNRGLSEIQSLERITETNLTALIFKKRLPQILGGYVAGGWVVFEIAKEVEFRKETEWVIPLAGVSIVFGFLAASIFGWFHGEKGQQRVQRVEMWLLGILVTGWIAALIWVLGPWGG